MSCSSKLENEKTCAPEGLFGHRKLRGHCEALDFDGFDGQAVELPD